MSQFKPTPADWLVLFAFLGMIFGVIYTWRTEVIQFLWEACKFVCMLTVQLVIIVGAPLLAIKMLVELRDYELPVNHVQIVDNSPPPNRAQRPRARSRSRSRPRASPGSTIRDIDVVRQVVADLSWPVPPGGWPARHPTNETLVAILAFNGVSTTKAKRSDLVDELMALAQR